MATARRTGNVEEYSLLIDAAAIISGDSLILTQTFIEIWISNHTANQPIDMGERKCFSPPKHLRKYSFVSSTSRQYFCHLISRYPIPNFFIYALASKLLPETVNIQPTRPVYLACQAFQSVLSRSNHSLLIRLFWPSHPWWANAPVLQEFFFMFCFLCWARGRCGETTVEHTAVQSKKWYHDSLLDDCFGSDVSERCMIRVPWKGRSNPLNADVDIFARVSRESRM